MEAKRLWTSGQWCEYFARNGQGSNLLTREAQVRLSDDEKQAVTKSLQAFQLGESSEGLHLYHCALEYGQKTGDVEYVEAIKLFIREEQRHAQYIARFMCLASIALTRKIFIDGVFRMLRRLAGLECSISVLITAEIIAEVYYRALYNATQSDFLKAICRQVLSDEKMHVQFQAERLAIIRKHRNKLNSLTTNFLQRFLFAGTILVVWMKCKDTLRAAECTVVSFFLQCWRELNNAMHLMDPRLYEDDSIVTMGVQSLKAQPTAENV
jgi:hypothetical protein